MNADPADDVAQAIIALLTFVIVWVVSVFGAGWLGFFLGWMPALAIAAIAYAIWQVVFVAFLLTLLAVLWQFR